jgi:hypothetical protein
MQIGDTAAFARAVVRLLTDKARGEMKTCCRR